VTSLKLVDGNNPDKPPASSTERSVWIRDDYWFTIAFGLLCTGVIALALGFVPYVGLGVGLVGVASGVVGAGIFARPIGLIIESGRGSLTVRSLASERHYPFSDLLGVDVRPSRQGWAIGEWPDVMGVRYDVVLCIRNTDDVTVRRELSLPVAQLEAHRLENLILRPSP